MSVCRTAAHTGWPPKFIRFGLHVGNVNWLLVQYRAAMIDPRTNGTVTRATRP
jgi:hypothetical protein